MRKNTQSVTWLQRLKLIIPLLALFVDWAISSLVPNVADVAADTPTYHAFLAAAGIAYLVLVAVSFALPRLHKGLVKYAWLIGATILIMAAYDIGTRKTGAMTLPFYPSIEKIFKFFVKNGEDILVATVESGSVLAEGLAWGVLGGCIFGILAGISHFCNYWIAPLLKIIGPIPSILWIPIAFIVTPSSHVAAVLVIAIAAWFPLALKISRGIKTLPKRPVECAKTLGASRFQVIFHVIVPLVLPAFFEGLFMSLSLAFCALAAADALGSSGGLPHMLDVNAQVIKYHAVWAVFVVLVAMFTVLVRLMFVIQKRLLRWRQGSRRW